MTETVLSHETGLEIAVIGMAGRFPGAKNIDEFWNNIKNGVESVSYLEDRELDRAGIAPGLKNNPNYVKVKGGVLEDKEFFDASFFGYTPKEAEVMDPQVRIFHECVWGALENAGYDPGVYNKSIGLYAGASSSFYWQGLSLLSGKGAELGQFESEHFEDSSYMCQLISYRLNLMGPSFSIQTACSTSLVAIHLGCQGILNGECEIALAGGVSLGYGKDLGYVYQEGMILSPDGHCRAFDREAKGTVGGEGAGVVVLKLLQHAIADRDNIHAVIKGSAVNNDGKRKVNFTAPSIKGQSEVIRTAHQIAEIEPGSICYLEAHGTGTPLGDPVEIEGMIKAFNTNKKGFCPIGSVKTNIGHLGAAAGVTGFIKTVLTLKHRLISPSLHFQTPNQKIDFENSPFYVNTQLKELKSAKHPLRAGVSSFGVGGTNAHVVLEESPVIGHWSLVIGERKEREYQLILLSAKTGIALEQMTRNLADYFKNNPGISLADAAYTLQRGRGAFQHRRMLVCSEVKEAIEALSPGPGKMQTFFAPIENRPVVFMFSGLGSQYVNMGLEIYEKEPVFREAVDHCFEILKPLMDYDIKKILYPGDSINKVSMLSEVSQPLLFVFEYALARLLMKWGIMPHAMIGYSFGEYAAACISGVFSLEQALKLVVSRMELIRKVPAGLMLSVPLPEDELKSLINSELSIAVDNGPSCIVAGSTEAVEAFEKQMKQKRLLCMRLEASHAIHSHMMNPILKEFEKTVGQFDLKKPAIPYISNVTGNWITVEQAVRPRHWARHLRETVRFAEGIKQLRKVDNAVFVQIGPGRDLSSLLVRHIGANPEQQVINLIPTPGKDVSDLYYLLNKIGRLWLYGVKIDWSEFYSNEIRNRVPLPTYPFESQPSRIKENEDLVKKGVEMISRGSLNTKKDIADWFYVPQWNRFMLQPGDAVEIAKGTRWLVFIDETGFGSKMVKLLEKKSMDAIEVKRGETFNRVNDHIYTINPRKAGDYISLVRELQTINKIPGYVLHFWGITNPGPGFKEQEPEIERAQYSGFYSFIYLARAIGKQSVSNDIQIAAVTDHVHAVTGEEILCPGKATGLAPIKIIPQEYPNLTCRSIDIVRPGPGSWQEDRLLHQLFEELRANSPDIIIAYRNNYRWIQQFQPVRLEERGKDIPRLRKKGVYLVTGGLGNIGLLLAEHLVKRVGARLVLTGRTTLPTRDEWEQWLSTHPGDDPVSHKILKLRALEAMGGEVLAPGVDAADPERMQEVITRAEERFGVINGVIHAAGLTDASAFQVVAEVTGAKCEQHFQSKVYGLLVLRNVLKGKELDFCLLTSSLAPILGGLSFVAYAAANLFMDAFVYLHNRANTVNWISVNWGDWQFGETESQSVAQLTMTPEQGLKTFERILHHYKMDQVIVSAVDLQARIDKWIKLDSVRGDYTSDKEELSSLHPRPNLLNPYVAPRNHEERIISGIWKMILGYDRLGIHDDFFELGGDSLKAITVISRVHKELHAALTLREFFDRPTIAGLSEYIINAEESTYLSIEPVEKKEYYPLSSAQKQLYIFQEIYKDGTAYNETQTAKLDGDIDKEKLEEIFKKLIARHESLRTSIKMVEDEPTQVIHDHVEFKIEYYDIEKVEVEEEVVPFGQISNAFGGRNPESQEPGAKSYIRSFIRPFDLSRAPFLRAKLIKIGETAHLVVLDMHHIITDGISNEIFLKEIVAFSREKMLPLSRLQYKDYSEWQNSEKMQEALKRQEEYWIKEFEGEIPQLRLPTDFSRPEIQNFEGSSIGFELNGEETKAVKEIARAEGTTLFMLLLAVFNIFLSKLSNQDDIVVGTPIAGRGHVDLEKIIGMFVNTLSMRNHTPGKERFAEFLHKVKERTLKIFENQDYPFEDLVEKVVVNRDMRHNPLFDVMFVLQNISETSAEKSEEKMETLNVEPYAYIKRTSKFDLTLTAVEAEEKLFFSFTYCTKLFKEETIVRFINYFKKIALSVVENFEQKISEIELITEEEKKQVIFVFNRTGTKYPKDKVIHELFQEQAEKTPDNIAVVGIGTWFSHPQTREHEVANLTYKELNKKSNQLALWLYKKGVQPGTIVGIMLNRSRQMITGLLAILKVGGAYLPIDPDYPTERIQYMLADSQAKILVTTPGLTVKFEKLSIVNCQLLIVNEKPPNRRRPYNPPRESNSINNYQLTINNLQLERTNLAYIIYTSGTTGKPKGVMVNHRNILAYINAYSQEFQLGPTDVAVLESSFSFDAFGEELYSILLKGGKLCVAQKYELMDVYLLKKLIVKYNITIMSSTPLMLNELNRLGGIKNVRTFVSGTDVLKGEHVDVLSNFSKVYNAYGPTETTVCATYYKVSGKLKANLPIGKPIANYQVYITNKYKKLQPLGVTGELWIGGDGVSRGYLNNPESTAGKFKRAVISHSSLVISSPKKLSKFTNDQCPMTNDRPQKFLPNDRLYRTGDLARWLPDGNIEFLGRIDHQVKIRGFRVELGEIESQLQKHGAIKETVVLAKEGGNGEKSLCAYVVSDRELELSHLREYLSGTLPHYMIPSYFVQIEKIPMAPNGKIDRKAMPAPGAAINEAYVPPGNETEKKLSHIWKMVLNIEGIGIRNNFFNIGGNSIKAITLINRVNNAFETNLQVMDLYMNETIERLAGNIGRKEKKEYDIKVKEIKNKLETLKQEIINLHAPGDNIEDIYPMSDIEKGMVFHSLKSIEEAVYHDQVVYQVSFKDFDVERFKRALFLMVEKHPILRTAFNIYDYEEPVQLVYRKIDSDYNHLDISYLEKKEQEKHIMDYLASNRRNPLNVSKPGMWNIRTFAPGNHRIILVFVSHHAILDGWSNASFMTELNNTYLRLKSEPGYIPGKLKSCYKTYIIEEQLVKRNHEIKHYWKQELLDYKRYVFPKTGVELDGKKTLKKYHYELGREFLKRLKKESVTYNTSVKNLCFAAYLFSLAVLSYENDITVGLVTNCRPSCEDGEKILGCFLNTIPFRLKIPGETRWIDYIKQVDVKLLELKKYENLSFLEITRIIGEQNREGNPVYDVFFNYIDFHIYSQAKSDNDEPADSTGKTGESLNVTGYNQTNILLDFSIDASFGNLSVILGYMSHIMTEKTASDLCRYFEQTLHKFIECPRDIVKKEDLLSPEEKKRLLYEFNDKKAGGQNDKTIHQWFEEQVEKIPDKVAVIFTNMVLTYSELNKRSSQLAVKLRMKGVKPDTVVGLMAKRSIETITAIPGIMKAGGAYLPIDTGYPGKRKRYMIEDSGINLLIIDPGKEGLSGYIPAAIEVIDIGDDTKYSGDSGNLKYINTGSDLVYVIYTSGSTGKPKGVMIEHKNVVNLIDYDQKYTNMDFSKIVQFHSIGFDASFHEIFCALLSGGELYLPDDETRTSLPGLFKLIEKNNIKTLFLPMSLLKIIFGEEENIKRIPGCLEHIQTAGEQVIISNTFKQYLQDNHVYLHNHYGPSETHVVTALTIDPAGTVPEFPSIGKPILNTTVYILDRENNLIPPGVPGELCVGGVQVGRGYLGKKELTEERFLVNPFVRGERMYKTGDLARWRPDGNIDFLGRIDQQVKIRGFRVEPGEIEEQLLNHENIKETVVQCRNDAHGEKYLCAFFVSDMELSVTALREYLSGELPAYMIPSYFVRLENIPLTPNGKPDRKALPDPKQMTPIEKDFLPPANEIENKIVNTWGDVLGIDTKKISIGDNFFELGGNSINILIMVNKISKEHNLEISLSEIFLHPTVRGLANSIQKRKLFNPLECVVRLNKGNADKNIFIIHQGGGMVYPYKKLARILAADSNVYGIQAKGLYREGRLPKNRKELLGDYIREIKIIQEQGPYIIAGYCLGGIISYEIVRILEDRGEQVRLLILFDESPYIGGLYIKFLRLKEFMLKKMARLPFIPPGKKDKNADIKGNIDDETGKRGNIKSKAITDGLEQRQEEVVDNLRRIANWLKPGRIINIPILVIKARDNVFTPSTSAAWKKLTNSDIIFVDVPGDHLNMFDLPYVKKLAEVIKKNIKEMY